MTGSRGFVYKLEEGVREELFDEQWSDEKDGGHLADVPEDEGAGERDFVTYEDNPHLVSEDYEDDEDSRQTEKIELQPSRFGRTRWANPKYI